MLSFVLDTSLITGLYSAGENFEEKLDGLLGIIARAQLDANIFCYIPYPSVYTELVHSLRRKEVKHELLVELDTWLVKKSPSRYEIKIPAEILYEYVGEVRDRINKGLKTAEESVLKTHKSKPEKPDNLIKELREKYREAMRQGMLDSKEDLDVLLLAKEVDGTVVALDNGIKKWSERLGLKYLDGGGFVKILKEYLSKE